MQRLSFNIADAEYNRSNDTIVAAGADRNELYIYNPALATSITIALSGKPLCVAVQPGGQFAAVGHAGAISYVDLRTQTVIFFAQVPATVADIILANNGYIYAFEHIGGSLGAYEIATGLWTRIDSPTQQYPRARLNSAQNTIYWNEKKWSIAGGLPVQVDVPSGPPCANAWLTEAGDRRIGCGNIYRVSANPLEEGQILGIAPQGIWFDHSQAQGQFAVAGGEFVDIYNNDLSMLATSIAIPRFDPQQPMLTAFGFWNSTGTKVYAVSRLFFASGVSGYPNWGVAELSVPSVCNYTLSPASIPVPYTGGTGTVTVTTQPGCPWQPSGGVEITNNAGGGSGSGSFSYRVGPNSSPNFLRRSISLGNTSALVTVAPNPGTVTLSPALVQVPASGGSPTVTVTTSNTYLAWNGVPLISGDWVRPPFIGMSGTGSGSIGFEVAANPGTQARSAVFRVNGQTLQVVQAGSSGGGATVPAATFIPGLGGSAQLAVVTSGAWTATSDAWWLNIANGASGQGNGTVTVAAILNPSKDARNARVTVGSTVYQVVQEGQSGLYFYPVAPCRIADTRTAPGPFGQPVVTGQTTRTFPVLDSPCGIPAHAVAYSLNVTAVPRGPLGYVTVYPAGDARPTVSLFNALDGRIKANSTIVRAGTGRGGVSLFATDTTDAILDINGYFSPVQTEDALVFHAVSLCRITDTRNVNGPRGGPMLQPGVGRTLPVGGYCQVPASARAYALNITAIPRQTLGYLTVWPSGQAQPLVSTLNATTGTITANAAILPAGVNGTIEAFANDATDLLVDVNGYFELAGFVPHEHRYFVVDPCRLADTRNPDGISGGPALQAGVARTIQGQTVCGLPTADFQMTVNATVIPTAGTFGYLTMWVAGQAQPTVSVLNAVDGAITSNGAIVQQNVIPAYFNVFGSSPGHLFLDVTGYFSRY